MVRQHKPPSSAVRPRVQPGPRLAVIAKDGVQLLGDPDEGGPAAQLLQLGCSHIGAGGSNPTQYISYGDVNGAFVGDLYRLPLRRPGEDRERGDI